MKRAPVSGNGGPRARRRARSAAGGLPDRDELLRLLRRRNQRRESLRRVDVLRDEPRLVTAAMKHFGSWPDAVAEAGFRVPGNQRWDTQRVIDEILRLHREGASLRKSHVPPPLFWAAWEHLGGWPEAIRRAGLDYEEVRPTATSPSSRAKLIAILRDAASSGRVGIGPDGFVTTRVADQARKAFGSFPAALAAAGLEPNIYKRRRQRPADELIAEMRELARAQPDMLVSAFRTLGLAHAVTKRFGSVAAAATAAGLLAWPRRKNFSLPSPDELLEALRARHRRGDPMRISDVVRSELHLAKAARKHFGSWRSAMRAAGLGELITYEQNWSKPQVRAELRARNLRGEPLDARSIKRDDPSLWSGARACFGTLPQALHDAGLSQPSSTAAIDRSKRERINRIE